MTNDACIDSQKDKTTAKCSRALASHSGVYFVFVLSTDFTAINNAQFLRNKQFTFSIIISMRQIEVLGSTAIACVLRSEATAVYGLVGLDCHSGG